jgi:hypothetical protein
MKIVFNTQLSEENIKSHIIHLYQLAKIDDRIVKEEKRFLYALGRKNGLQEAQVDKYIEEACGHSFVIPQGKKERLVYLYDYIKMMLVDQKLDEREAKMCKVIAEKMGFAMALVNGIAKAIVTAEEDNVSPSISEAELESYIKNPELF